MTAHAKKHTSEGWSQRVELACAARGLQLTPLRRQVVSILSENGAPIGAYAIIEKLSKVESKQIAPPTVYRTLDFLLENGFLHKIESRNVFAPCEHFEHTHNNVLLLCEACGRSEEIEDMALDKSLRDTTERVGFVMHRQTLELQGLCRLCASPKRDI